MSELKQSDYLNEFEIEWLKALRSGNYKQGRGQLRYDENYCCLGVACDISKIGGWRQIYDDDNYYEYSYILNKEKHSNSIFLPDTLAIKLNLDGPLGEKLMNLNDGGSSFVEIADFYEDYKKKLYLNKGE